jgi:hypothetical protein
VKGGYPLLFSGFVCSGSRLPEPGNLWAEDLILMELNFLVWGPSGGVCLGRMCSDLRFTCFGFGGECGGEA